MTEARCEMIRERIVETLYEETTPEGLAELAEHLAACPRCHREEESLRETRGLLRSAWPDPIPLPGSRVLVLGRPQPRRRWRTAGWAAAAAVVLTAVAALLNPRIGIVADGVTLSLGWPARARGLSADERAEMEAALKAAEEGIRRQQAAQQAEILRALEDELDRRDARGGEERDAALASLLDDVDRRRVRDLRLLLSEVGSLETRTGREMARTNEWVRYAVLAGAAPPER